MTGHLDHSPADILRYVMIANSLGTLPPGTNDWMIFAHNEPNTPDNCITIYDLTNRQFGRSQPDGMIDEMQGIQVRVRSSVSEVGYPKARELAIFLDEQLYQELITISSSSYCVHSFSRNGGVRILGKDSSTPTGRTITIFEGFLSVKQKVLGTGSFF